jgi:hypothetical protein
MACVALRQYRMELFIALALFAALTAFLVPSGLGKLALFQDSGLEACLNARTENCGELGARFTQSYHKLDVIVGWFNFVPAIVGLLLAAPVIIEFEQRTYRLVWTQSITRGRWLATKLGMALLGALIFSAAFTLLMTWWYSPLDRVESRFVSQTFNFEGAMPLAYTVFALALALAAGVLSRRTIVAVLATVVGFIALRVPVEVVLRPDYLAPTEQIRALDGGMEPLNGRAWMLESGYVDAAGNAISAQQVAQICGTLPGIKSDIPCPAAGDIFIRSLFHADDRFWTFQAIEAAIFLGLATMLVFLTVCVVTKRMS